ncbi:ABC transporter ATP-binding protein [Streptomyces kurssanovii]|nr:ABC transporter ATP-binding protein [Streptomyces kurssanovii]
MSYDRAVRLATTDFAAAVTAVRRALADQGFGVLTEIDVTATLKAKLDHDMEDYLILGACNPPLARRALEVDRSIGLLLPCNVVVRRYDDHTLVQALDPGTMVTLTGLDTLGPVAEEATTRLDAALNALSAA